MSHLTRPLRAGSPVTLWRHSDVSEQPWDVAERPMEGEMDPFFFMTKERNFIPHEYPCRTEFAERYRGAPPEERATGRLRRSGWGSGHRGSICRASGSAPPGSPRGPRFC